MPTKKAVRKKAKPKLRSYLCSNPTCKKVFEKPKVVRYYACPFCLSRFEKNPQTKNLLKESKERSEPQIESKLVRMDEKKEVRTVEVETAQVPEEVELPVKIDSVKTEDNRCKYHFGYLHERGKGERIPDGCIECPKSVDCMLSGFYPSQSAVSEIKKWYSLFK